MTRTSGIWWLLGGGALVWLLYANRQTIGSAASSTGGAIQSGVEDVQAALTGWQSVGQGPTWVPVLNAAEAQFNIPANLLARVAYQESRFRSDIIDGTTASPAGALGIMQMMPIFSSVNVPRPFTAADTTAQIQQAAGELARLYGVFHDWPLSLAAYNDGQGNITNYLNGTHQLPEETANYVADILADVPVASGLPG